MVMDVGLPGYLMGVRCWVTGLPHGCEMLGYRVTRANCKPGSEGLVHASIVVSQYLFTIFIDQI